MNERYDPAAIEPRWQRRWEETRLHEADADPARPKRYVVTMYPYPSGDLHVGHWYPMTPTDAWARFQRMQGYNVLYPMGFDAFGLPAENAAIKRGIHPKTWTYENIRQMERQLRIMGIGVDWRREIITCDPSYYRWNQWLFLKFRERGLAYRAFAPVDWCPSCNTTLAREQVVTQDRVCERCETPVIKKELFQWFLKITAYAEELLDYSDMDWPERIRTLQTNWIGRSTGAQFSFSVRETGDMFSVFTTRPDTLFGATFCVLAPEHCLVDRITTPDRRAEVAAYVAQAVRQTEIERLNAQKERTGVATGAFAVHPFTGADIPIYVADYVLATYGTGAIMAVPAHDERDFDFARAHGLPIPVVIRPPGWDGGEIEAAYTGEGEMVNSGQFDGLPSDRGREAVTAELERMGIGRATVNYRLRDWLISRQRMWGTPIPIIHCEACGEVPVPYEELPVTLPDDVSFRPTGESPLKSHPGFLNAPCPRCGAPAVRESDTMDTFVDSSWYQYRYLSPHDEERPFGGEDASYWLPVDLYTGGPEHAVLHLLYTRFFHKVMRDMGLFDEPRRRHPDRNWNEPFPRLFTQGIITSFTYRDRDGRIVPNADVVFQGDTPVCRHSGRVLTATVERMSKSKGNVEAPDDYLRQYGTDTVRLFLMFIGPWDQGGPWNPRGVEGIVRFLNRVWTLAQPLVGGPNGGEGPAADELRRALHRTLKKVTADFERFAFNTAIAALMELTNTLSRIRGTPVAGSPAWNEAIDTLLLMLAPMAPHIAEELWERRGRAYSIHTQAWPAHDEALAQETLVEVGVQVNGKLRDRMTISVTDSEETVRERALALPRVAELVGERPVRKFIYVPGRLANIVIG